LTEEDNTGVTPLRTPKPAGIPVNSATFAGNLPLSATNPDNRISPP